MKIKSNIIPLFLFALIICSASTVPAASFFADMVTREDGKAQEGKFYLSGPFYRMEVSEGENPIAIIVDREKRVHLVLNIKEKVFYEISSGNRIIGMMDPFLNSDNIVSRFGKEVEDVEEISGIMCEKQVALHSGYTRWFSKEFNFPLKIVLYNGDIEKSVVELKNIKQVNPPNEMFTVPAEFKKTDDPWGIAKREREAKESQKEKPGLNAPSKNEHPSNTGTQSSDGEDLIYKKCMSQTDDPGPWCYQREVKKVGDPSLCDNILKYWPKAGGVSGQCYYELARKKMDCELCKRIKEKDIKRMCELDVCK